MRYELMVKTLHGGALPASRVKAPNPAMQRHGVIEMDEGRPWAGDLYDEGPVTDPSESYAQFAGGEDVEAWLDRDDDGTLIGWVREGNDIYRYSDAEAWALDVDGAGMSRSDAPAPDAAVPELVEPGAPAAEPTTTVPAASAEVDELDPLGLDAPTAPEGFDAEADPATTEADPTDPLEDPTKVDDETSEVATNPFDGLTDEDAELAEPAAPAVDPATEPEPEVTDPAPQAEEPTDEPAEEPTAGPEGEPAAADDDEEAKRRIHRKSAADLVLEVKHLAGQHNQETHGNRAGVRSAIGMIAPRARRAGSDSGTGAGDASSAPKAGEAPAKGRLDADTIGRLSDEDLTAIMESDDLYEPATMMAAAEELDRRDDLHDRVAGLASDAAPGSPEEAAAFGAVVNPLWAAWAARDGKGKQPTRREQVEEAWTDYWLSLMARAESEAIRGGDYINASSSWEQLGRLHLRPEDFFNGRMSRAQIRKYGSVELREWLDEHAMSKREFLAEFYPSYAKLLRGLGSDAVSENG